jgi:hypothetical protein
MIPWWTLLIALLAGFVGGCFYGSYLEKETRQLAGVVKKDILEFEQHVAEGLARLKAKL